jgi:hypothetical protein
MKMSILFLLAAFIFHFSGAAQFDSASVYKSYNAAFIYNDSLYSFDSSTHLVKDSAKFLRHDSSLIHTLVNAYSTTTIYSVEADGKLGLLSNNASLSKSSYKVIYEYSQTQPLKKQFNDSISKVLGVGISVRMVATLYSIKGSLDLSHIASFISASANSSKINGFLEVKVNGIESKVINTLIPTPTTISPESIIAALQAMAAIKSHFNDADVRIIPEVVGYYDLDKSEVFIANTLKAYQ